ncbi:MAG: nucleotide exchange factor GrpE [Mycoplasmoidaceae bacterium]
MSKETKNKINEENTVNPQISILENELKLEKEKNLDNQKRIENLEKEKNELSIFFKDELIRKSKLAQEEVNRKVEEIKRQLDAETKIAKKYAIENQALDLINITQQLKSAVSQDVDDLKLNNYLLGFRMISRMLEELLISMGIREIKVKIGDPFNEKFMEGVATSKLDGVEVGCISKIIRNGYSLYERVIQFVQVEVKE